MAATMQIHEMSKTYQYRKVMKPMLERKRRARINKCLDELKDLMVATLESEGEHVTRLEKADILELTVQHLQKLKQKRQLGLENYQQNSILSQAEGFRSGFVYAANEISKNLANLPGVNINFGAKLMTHLGQRLNQIQSTATTTTIQSPKIASLHTQITNSNIKIPIPIHHPITINCGGQTAASSIFSPSTSTSTISPNVTNSTMLSSSLKSTSFGSNSAQLSPISNYSISPKPHQSIYNTDLQPKNIINGGSANHYLVEPEENVWRPW